MSTPILSQVGYHGFLAVAVILAVIIVLVWRFKLYRLSELKKVGPPLLQGLIHYAPFVIVLLGFIGCLIIELAHIPISMESRAQFYSVFGSVSFYSSILLNTVYGRKYGLGWIKSFVFSFLSFQVVFSLLSGANAQLDVFLFGVGGYASFRSAMALPLLCLILARFCKVDTLNLCDYLTPYFFFHHGAVTIACWIQGCCGGKTWAWGLCNPLSGLTVFPTQPLIILLSIAAAYWGLYYSKKQSYQANGIVFANTLIIYGFFRYLIELFSDDPRVFWVSSWLSICSLAMIAEGFLLRYIIGKRMQTTKRVKGVISNVRSKK